MPQTEQLRVGFLASPPENGGIGRYNEQLMGLVESTGEVQARLCAVEEGQSARAYVTNASDATAGDVAHLQFEYGLFRPKLLYSWIFLLSLLVLSRLRQTPVVVTIHEVWTVETVGRIQYAYVWLVHGLLAVVASKLVFMAPNSKASFRPNGLVRTAEIPHGVDTSAVRNSNREDARETFGLPDDSTVISQIGYVSPRKGTDTFLELAARNPEYEFLLAGGPLREEDEPYFDQVTASLPENVRVTGVLSDDEFHEAFVATDVAVLAYTDIYQSGILNWCFAYGVPAVCSAIDRFEYLRADGAQLVLFEENAESYPPVGEALRTAVDNAKELRAEMQSYGKANSLTATAEQYSTLYRSLTERGIAA